MKKMTILIVLLIILLFIGLGGPPYFELKVPGKICNDIISEVGFLPYMSFLGG